MSSPDAPAVVDVLGAVVDELGNKNSDCDRELEQNVEPATQVGRGHLAVEKCASLQNTVIFSVGY